MAPQAQCPCVLGVPRADLRREKKQDEDWQEKARQKAATNVQGEEHRSGEGGGVDGAGLCETVGESDGYEVL